MAAWWGWGEGQFGRFGRTWLAAATAALSTVGGAAAVWQLSGHDDAGPSTPRSVYILARTLAAVVAAEVHAGSSRLGERSPLPRPLPRPGAL